MKEAMIKTFTSTEMSHRIVGATNTMINLGERMLNSYDCPIYQKILHF